MPTYGAKTITARFAALTEGRKALYVWSNNHGFTFGYGLSKVLQAAEAIQWGRSEWLLLPPGMLLAGFHSGSQIYAKGGWEAQYSGE
jgi:hypothetical protein